MRILATSMAVLGAMGAALAIHPNREVFFGSPLPNLREGAASKPTRSKRTVAQDRRRAAKRRAVIRAKRLGHA
ncbi:hypothetical protein [Gemmobacter denitrificans]|uniref:Uncharacterized protein n=1 Tax=Gemmobacter denitrificans TaxID=3123040 RepID=A0ABU8BTP5_9RHOB